MARIQTFDHTGFMVQDIPRAHKFYDDLLGARPLWTANLNLKAYDGWPIMSFVEMGGHRFELCLAMEALPDKDQGNAMPRIGFSVKDEELNNIVRQLDEANVPYEGPLTYPDAIPLKETIRVFDPDGNVLEFSTVK
jgi:catechol 2,3-dioxygenase-like lactoylglutathione lyase family enzyme